MKAFLYKSKLLIIIFCVSAFFMTLTSASIIKFSYATHKEIPGISDDFIIYEIIGEYDLNSKLKVKNMLEYIENQNDSYMLTKKLIGAMSRAIVYTDDYNLEVKLLQGRVFNKNDFSTHANVAVVSEDILEECIEKDGIKYIIHLGLPYKVIGVYEGIIGNSIDEITYYVNLKGSNMMSESFLGMYYFDSNYDTGSKFNKIKDSILTQNKNISINFIEGMSKDSTKFTGMLSNSKLMIAIILIGGILVIMNAYSSTLIWIVARKKEMGLRRMFGGQSYQIYMWLIKEYMKIIVISFLVGLLPTILFIINTKSIKAVPSAYHLFGDKFSPEYVVISFLILMSQGMLILLLAIKKYNKDMIVGNLR